MFRFAYFAIDGKKIKEVTIFKQVLKRAGVPLGIANLDTGQRKSTFTIRI